MTSYGGKSFYGINNIKPTSTMKSKGWLLATFYAGGKKLLSLLGVGK